MSIVECLKGDGNSSTLTTGNRWLYWDGKQWVVKKHSGGKRQRCETVLETQDESNAVSALLQERD